MAITQSSARRQAGPGAPRSIAHHRGNQSSPNVGSPTRRLRLLSAERAKSKFDCTETDAPRARDKDRVVKDRPAATMRASPRSPRCALIFAQAAEEASAPGHPRIDIVERRLRSSVRRSKSATRSCTPPRRRADVVAALRSARAGRTRRSAARSSPKTSEFRLP